MRSWLPPTQGIARLGELRLFVVDSARGRLLWRGGRLYRLPDHVKDAESLEEFEEGHSLPDIEDRFHLGVDGSGRQLLIIPYRATSPHGAGLGSSASPDVHEMLKAFLGRRAENAYGVQIERPRNVQPIGQVRLVIYSCSKPHLSQSGEFVHGFTRPFPTMYVGPDGWYLGGGRVFVDWKGIQG